MIDAVAAPPGFRSNKFTDDAGKVPLVPLGANDRPSHCFAEQRGRIDRLLLGDHIEMKAEGPRQTFAAIEFLKNECVGTERGRHREPVIHLPPAIRQYLSRQSRPARADTSKPPWSSRAAAYFVAAGLPAVR